VQYLPKSNETTINFDLIFYYVYLVEHRMYIETLRVYSGGHACACEPSSQMLSGNMSTRFSTHIINSFLSHPVGDWQATVIDESGGNTSDCAARDPATESYHGQFVHLHRNH